jgi:hypothetical protein
MSSSSSSSSSYSKSPKAPKALSRQHSRDPSISPRFNGGPAPSPIGLLPASVENPLPPRIYRGIQLTSRSITQRPRIPIPTVPNLVRQYEWRKFQDQNMGLLDAEDAFQRQALMPPRLSPGRLAASIIDPFAPFRNHIHMNMELGTTILELDDGTIIDMGNVGINQAIGMLRKVTDSTDFVTYEVVGFPKIKMIILPDARIILLRHPSMSEQSGKFIRRQKTGGRRRTISRKMGRNGTIKCRRRWRRCMNYTWRK